MSDILTRYQHLIERAEIGPFAQSDYVRELATALVATTLLVDDLEQAGEKRKSLTRVFDAAELSSQIVDAELTANHSTDPELVQKLRSYGTVMRKVLTLLNQIGELDDADGTADEPMSPAAADDPIVEALRVEAQAQGISMHELVFGALRSDRERSGS